MAVFERILRRLLPDGAAFRAAVGTAVRKVVEGLASGPDAARAYIDGVYRDLHPDTTRELERWESQFGLPSSGSDEVRRERLAGAWQATGGQDPHYLQAIVQASGFDLYVHEWWSSGPDPWVARDPRDYTDVPLIGTVQCGEPLAQCGEPTAVCNAFLANDPGYIVNLDLSPRPPPPVPSDPDTWPYFLYFGGETFGTLADVPLSRRAELEELLLRICPAQHWIVLMVNWIAGSTARVTLDGTPRVTLDGTPRVTLDLL